MKILLTTLNSKYIHTNLSVKYLYAAAKDYCDVLDVQEFTINNPEDYIYTELVRQDYDMLCFSCYIWNIESTLYLCQNMKKAKPDIKILLGGPEVSFKPYEILQQNDYVDYIIAGEGEEAFKQFCKYLHAGEPAINTIWGLTYRQDETIYVNPQDNPVNMDSVPFPYDYLPLEKDKIIYYESSRGCPFNCNYCLSSVDKRVRKLPIPRVKRELGYFICNNVKQVKLIDRTFNFDPGRCVDILKYLIFRDNGITNFHFELCGDLIDEEFLKTVSGARKGLFQFEIGIQSTNPDTLAAVKRSGDVLRTFQNIRRLIALDIAEIHVDLITGLPHEDRNSFVASFNDVYSLCADSIHLGFLKMLKGTGIREGDKIYRYIYRERAPYEVISNKFLSASDITDVKQIEAILDLYYNRGGFEKTVRYLIKCCGNVPFDFYREFSRFYYFKGYQHANHSKEDLYRILYSYLDWKSQRYDAEPGMKDTGLAFLEKDMADRLNFDAVKKFKAKGWEL